MMSPPVWLPGPMFLQGEVSLPGPMFLLGSLLGVSVQGGSLQGCKETPEIRKADDTHPGLLSCLVF